MTSGFEPSEPELHGPIELPAAQLGSLRSSYLAPARAYHHFGHVQEVLRHYRAVAEGPGWRRPTEIWLAVLYHDAVYVPGRSDNEAASARLAVEHIDRWWQGAGIDAGRIADLIRLTACHGALRAEDVGNGDMGEDARLFLDCDMAILGAPPAEFVAYDRAIAEEYRAVPRWLYRIRRRRFFRKLLASEWIFLSGFFRERFERQARENLRAALDSGIDG
jgi:predicted metal-dependent HD superfamily phosphohydrolase